MDWIIVQLTTYARLKIPSEKIEDSIASVLYQDPLYIYLPIYEDGFGKKLDYGFGEYAFINYCEGTDYTVLENLSEVIRIIVEPHSRLPAIISNDQVWDIKDKIDSNKRLEKDDVVKIISGNLRNNYGIVESVNEEHVRLIVMVGQESLQATVPIQHIRKSVRHTSLHKRELESNSFNIKINIEEKDSDFKEVLKIQFIRRGTRKTRTLIGNKIYMLPNEDIDEILLLYDDISEDELASRIIKLISRDGISEEGG